jgi:hypothetical protein
MDESVGVALDCLEKNPNYDFLHILGARDDSDDSSTSFQDSPYDGANVMCLYLDEYTYSQNYANQNNFSILSLNIQSLPSKFAEFSEFVKFLLLSKSAPDIICLQELWQFPDSSIFNIDGYNPIVYKLIRNNVQGGGVGMYIKDGIKFNLLPALSVFVDRVFESLFVEIHPKNSKKIIVGTVYRPGSKHPNQSSSEQFNQFMDLLANICNEISILNSPVYIAGDINLDVLHYNDNDNVAEYIDLLFSFGLLQVVTKPTRVSCHSATLIDHVLTNVSTSEHKTVVITSKLSDHFPIIHFLNNFKQSKSQDFISSRDLSQNNIDRFCNNLANLDWSNVTDSNDPQSAYNFFCDTFLGLYDIHFPVQRKPFNRNFHGLEKWMSSGILTSRREKN